MKALAILLTTILPAVSSAQNAGTDRAFKGFLYAGYYTEDSGVYSGLAFFFDSTRVEFQVADAAKPSPDEILKSVAATGPSKSSLEMPALFAQSGTGLIIEGKAAETMLGIIVYPRKGTPSGKLIKHPMAFAPGTVTLLNDIISRHGQPTERELWSTELTRDVALDGTVYWWGDVGIAAGTDGTITHVLVRQAPKRK